MEDGCVFCQHNGLTGYFCTKHYGIRKDGSYAVKCKGTVEEKKKCPEWAIILLNEKIIKNSMKVKDNASKNK